MIGRGQGRAWTQELQRDLATALWRGASTEGGLPSRKQTSANSTGKAGREGIGMTAATMSLSLDRQLMGIIATNDWFRA